MKTRLKVLVGFIALFSFVVALVLHFPASYLVKKLNPQLPPGLLLNQVNGTLWQGDLQISWQQNPMGKLAWQTEFWPLLTGYTQLKLHWQQGMSQLDIQLRSNRDRLQVQKLQGDIELAQISQPFQSQYFFLRGLSGGVHLRDIQAELEYDPLWTKTVGGQVLVTDFQVMDIQIDQLRLTPSQTADDLDVAIGGQGPGWTLDGQAQLTPPNSYQYQIQLKADSQNTMPDWVPMMMRQTSPTQAQANNRGQW